MGQNSRQTYGMTMGTVNVNLSRGTTSTYTTAAASAGQINGKWVTPLTAQTNAASPIVDAATGLAFVPLPINSATVIVYGQTAAGVIQMAQGSIEPTLPGSGNTAGSFIRAPQFPMVPDNFMEFAYFLVRTAPSAALFTAGTSSWTATGITASTVQNIGTFPDRPQIV